MDMWGQMFKWMEQIFKKQGKKEITTHDGILVYRIIRQSFLWVVSAVVYMLLPRLKKMIM